MRKSWKWALCLGVVSLLLLGGCGKEKTEPVDLVLVTDGSEVASDAVYQSAWNGLAQYGDESGLKYEASVPAGRTTEDYENTIKEAAQKGASVIVCAGTSMSRAVYDAQRDWKDVRFLLLEAEPVSESGRSRLRGNTESLEIDVSEAGYLAGYAAVQAGYTHLGYIGQKNEENGTKYGTGYALGAEAAAADLGLGSCWIHRAKEEFESEEGKGILKALGIEGDYEGIGHCVLGYAAEPAKEPKERKASYVYYAE